MHIVYMVEPVAPTVPPVQPLLHSSSLLQDRVATYMLADFPGNGIYSTQPHDRALIASADSLCRVSLPLVARIVGLLHSSLPMRGSPN